MHHDNITDLQNIELAGLELLGDSLDILEVVSQDQAEVHGFLSEVILTNCACVSLTFGIGVVGRSWL